MLAVEVGFVVYVRGRWLSRVGWLGWIVLDGHFGMEVGELRDLCLGRQAGRQAGRQTVE